MAVRKLFFVMSLLWAGMATAGQASSSFEVRVTLVTSEFLCATGTAVTLPTGAVIGRRTLDGGDCVPDASHRFHFFPAPGGVQGAFEPWGPLAAQTARGVSVFYDRTLAPPVQTQTPIATSDEGVYEIQIVW